jgi:spore germination cell wall hydrolase CwlJ-like protein
VDYLQRLTDTELLALTVAGEADDQPLAGRVAVACVAVERLRRGRWGDTLRKVLLQPYQFSTFDGVHWQRFTHRIGAHTALAELAIERLLNSSVNSATHYHTVDVLPGWAKSSAMISRGQIGSHLFYTEK